MASVIRGSGESTLGGALDVQGVLTYEDVTNVDSVGIITARNGIRIPSGSLGIGTETPANTFQLGDSNSSNVIIAPNLGVDINDGALNLYQATDNVNATPFIISTDVGSGTENEKLRFTAGGNLGIGTDNPTTTLHIQSTNTSGDLTIERVGNNANGPELILRHISETPADNDYIGQITFSGRDDANNNTTVARIDGLMTDVTNGSEDGELVFNTRSNGSFAERLRITSAGRVLLGIQTPRAGVFNTNLITPFFQMESAGQVDHNRMMTLVSNPGASGGYEPIFIFGKSRGTDAGDFDAVGNNDGLGAISFQGADGTELVEAARISAAVDGAVNTVDDMPGRLDFWVTKDGASGVVNPTMRIHNTGYMNVGGYIDSNDINRLNGINAPQGTHIATISGYQSSNGSSQDTALFYSVDASGGANAGATAIKVQRHSQTLRSINCGGSVNTSGNDYAEYMVKAGDFTIAKGDICGVNAQGKLTNVFADAVTFVVKSTDPSYVGGDTWDTVAGEEPGGYDDTRTGEELEAAKVAFKEQLEVVRQTVDRIAFCGQTPVNVTGTTPGQYIIPTANSDGSISGTAKSEGDLTLAEYMSSVGKVIAIEEDGRAKIIVKVS